MKKILVVCAALMLPCLLVHAQEADNTTKEEGIVLNVIPRIDLNPVFSTAKGGDNDFNWGNTAFYTLFEGNLADNLSFSVENHWFREKPKGLYKNIGHSDDVNFIDWAYLTLTLGNWEISAGKQMITTGGFEFDDYDFDVHSELQSGLWNTLACYQWGAKVGWNVSETTYFGGQITTSPLAEKFFKGGLFTYSGEWRGTYGNFSTISSISFIQGTKLGEGTKFMDCFAKLLAVGLRYDAEPVVLTMDVFNKVGANDEMLGGWTIMPSADWTVNDNLGLIFKASLERTKNDIPDVKKNAITAGVAAHWFPLKDKGLRLHATCAYNNRFETMTLSAGVLYNFSLKVK